MVSEKKVAFVGAKPSAGLSMRSLVLLVVAALVLVLGLVVTRLPASWFAYGLTQALPGLYLNGVNGNLWHGQAATGTLVIDGKGLGLGQVSWTLSPMSLLTFSPCADLQTDSKSLQFSSHVCSLGGSALQLDNLDVSLPANLLSLWLPVKLQGQISLLAQSAEIKQQQLQSLDGSLSWRDGYFHNGQQWLSLGSYGAQLSADGQAGINAAVTDLGGPFAAKLQLNLNPTLRPNSFTALAVKGELTPRGSANPELTRWLPTLVQIGAAEANGEGYRIDWVDN